MDTSYLYMLFVVVLSFIVYFLPTLIAARRSHPYNMAIFVLNLLLGWTFVGWVISLVWSFASPAPKESA